MVGNQLGLAGWCKYTSSMYVCRDLAAQYCSKAAKAICPLVSSSIQAALNRYYARRPTSSGANRPMTNHPICLAIWWPPKMWMSLCFQLLVVSFLNQAVHGKAASGQVPGRLRWTIFQVHNASVTKQVVRMLKVPLWSGCGSNLKVANTWVMETLPMLSVPATRSHMVAVAEAMSRRLTLLRVEAGAEALIARDKICSDVACRCSRGNETSSESLTQGSRILWWRWWWTKCYRHGP